MRVGSLVAAILLSSIMGPAYGESPVAEKLSNEAVDLYDNHGQLDAALQKVDEALRVDPKYWPARYYRGRLLIKKQKYEAAVRDFDEVLRQAPHFIMAAIARANANKKLGRFGLALKELDYVIKLRPPNEDTFADAYNERAWLRATCTDASFRNGQLAIKDGKIACRMSSWKDASYLNTLAAAHAEAGDFASAIQFQERAVAIASKSKDFTPASREKFQKYLDQFKQHRPVRQ
jgi:tetratricopeptide (TPR) repeat protein